MSSLTIFIVLLSILSLSQSSRIVDDADEQSQCIDWYTSFHWALPNESGRVFVDYWRYQYERQGCRVAGRASVLD